MQEVNHEAFRIFELLRQPIVISFVDFNNEDKEIAKASINLVDNVLKELGPHFYHGLIIAYADNNLYAGHRKRLGITNDRYAFPS